jgi:hypothetical protein
MGHAFRPRVTTNEAAHKARSARSDVRAADLQEEPTKPTERGMTFQDSRFVGSDEGGGYPANIAASAASHQTSRAPASGAIKHRGG